MVVNLEGRMCSQRVDPKLSLVIVEMPSEAFLEGWQPTKNSYMGIFLHNLHAL